jgi:two-component system phosphate regulon sensor histidine kinase PhoR
MLISTGRNKEPKPQRVLFNILDATPEGVLIVGPDMRIITGNDAARSAFSGMYGHLENLLVDTIIQNTEVIDAFRQAFDENEISDIHFEYSSRATRRYDVHVAPLELDYGRAAIGFFYDVTQVHRLENIRQEFLSNISHELRTPLTSILAFVETLEEGGLDDEENNRRFLNVIRRNGERMRNLIADILELSQIESGNIVIRSADLQLADLVDDVFSDLSSMAELREITLRNEVDRLLTVQADKKRLEQMITNLVDNAIRFNKTGGSVTIDAGTRGRKNFIYVSDTGEGIARDQLQRIFERFYRVDRARSREVGGTGLGLAIVKHLARLHGGEVTVESRIGTGTKFNIELPA